jgi:hypothetical protein
LWGSRVSSWFQGRTEEHLGNKMIREIGGIR